MEPAAYATYKLQVQGLFFLGLILGTVIAEVFFSGRLSDWLVMFLAKRNNGQRTPEMRLWLGYPAAVLSSLGLLIWGLSIDKEWHWITGQIAFFLCEWSGVEDEYMHRNLADGCTDGAGLQIGNTALSSYIVDSYYEHSMDIITFYTVIINVSLGFSNLNFVNGLRLTCLLAFCLRGAVVHKYLG
jgi:hypothetical protein